MPPEHRFAVFQLVRKLVKAERSKRELLPDRHVCLDRRELPEVSRPFAVELRGVHIQTEILLVSIQPTYVVVLSSRCAENSGSSPSFY